MVSRSRNLSRLGLPCVEVEELITYSGLLPLCNTNYEEIGKGLLFDLSSGGKGIPVPSTCLLVK